MRTYIKNLIIASLLLLPVMSLGVANAVPYPASVSQVASFKSSACDGVKEVGGGGSCTADDGKEFKDIFKTITDIILLLVGILAVIMIIISGFKYIASGGDSNKVSGAKSTLIYALIGLALAVLAKVIVSFVLSTAK